jgi:hypothetical protein
VHDHLIPRSMECLGIDLFNSLDLDEAHCRSSDRLGYCLSVKRVVLVRLQIRLHELCRHDFHRVTA